MGEIKEYSLRYGVRELLPTGQEHRCLLYGWLGLEYQFKDFDDNDFSVHRVKRISEVRNFLQQRGERIIGIQTVPEADSLIIWTESMVKKESAECPKCTGEALKAEEDLQMIRLGKGDTAGIR